MHRIGIACITLGIFVCACTALWAAEPLRGGRIAAPQQPTYAPLPADTAPAAPEYKAHTFYLGGVAGYNFGIQQREGVEGEDARPFSFIDGDETWQAGVVAGYLWRSGVLGLGVEADYVVRDLGDFAIDDGTATLRGRAGVFVGAGTFLYATAGVGEAYTDAVSDGFRRGPVVGGGVEKDIAANLALRIEALHYRHADDYLDWGEEGSTAVRLGAIAKF